jgi:hypothetical protein
VDVEELRSWRHRTQGRDWLRHDARPVRPGRRRRGVIICVKY